MEPESASPKETRGYPGRLARAGDFAWPLDGPYSDRVGMVAGVRDGVASVKLWDNGLTLHRKYPVDRLLVYKLAEDVQLS
jgi:hypothetical protein